MPAETFLRDGLPVRQEHSGEIERASRVLDPPAAATAQPRRWLSSRITMKTGSTTTAPSMK